MFDTFLEYLGGIRFLSVVLNRASFFSPFPHFAAVSLLVVAGLAETFPFFSVCGSFLHDFPGVLAPSDCIVSSQLRSSSRAHPLHLHFGNCSDVFSLISYFDVPPLSGQFAVIYCRTVGGSIWAGIFVGFQVGQDMLDAGG